MERKVEHLDDLSQESSACMCCFLSDDSIFLSFLLLLSYKPFSGTYTAESNDEDDDSISSCDFLDETRMEPPKGFGEETHEYHWDREPLEGVESDAEHDACQGCHWQVIENFVRSSNQNEDEDRLKNT